MPALGLAGIGALLVAALPRGTEAPAGSSGGVLRIAGADPRSGLFDPTTPVADLRGRVVVMAFASRDCQECRDPFGASHDAFLGNVTFVQVIRDVTPAEGRRISENRLPELGFRATPVAIDPDGTLAERLGVTAEPTILVLDRAGNEAARYTTSAPEGLQRLLPDLIRQAPPAGFPRPRPAQPELGVFSKRPPADTSRIPGFTLRTLLDSCQAVPGSIRLAASAPGGLRLWIAKSMDGSMAYASTYGRFDRGGGIGCGAGRHEANRQKTLRQIRGSGVVLWEGGQSKGRWFAALALMDGWTEVRIGGQRIPVTTNGMITTGTGTRPRTAILSGPRGSRTFRFR